MTKSHQKNHGRKVVQHHPAPRNFGVMVLCHVIGDITLMGGD